MQNKDIIDEIPQEFDSIAALELIIDRFTHTASQLEGADAVNKLLQVAERASRLLDSISGRRQKTTSILSLVGSWVQTGIHQAALYSVYRDFCLANDLDTWTKRMFFDLLRDAGYHFVRRKDTSWVLPPKLKAQGVSLLE